MSFFNTFRFCLDIAASITAYHLFIYFLPKINRDYPLLLLSLFWAKFFLKLPILFLAAWIFFLCIFYGTSKLIKKNGIGSWITVLLSILIGTLWISLRFPAFSAILKINFEESHSIGRYFTYFIGFPYTACRLYSFIRDSKNQTIQNPSLVKFLLFINYFPSWISGPITRYSSFELTQAKANGTYWKKNLKPGLKKIVQGVIKRELLAEIFSAIALPFIPLDSSTKPALLLGAYAYFFYLYFDFSGYSDMAVGLSKLLKIEMPENFNRPYLAKNPVDFWERWHISLTRWLYDYILTPLYLFLMKHFSFFSKNVLSFLAIISTFLFAGIWHGEGRQFLYYGLFNGIGFWLYRLSTDTCKKINFSLYKKIESSQSLNKISIFFCFHYMVLALMIFSLSSKQIHLVVSRIFRG